LSTWSPQSSGCLKEVLPSTVDDFETVLSDAVDEKPLQLFLAANPALLSPLAPHGSTYWCLDRPRLGSEFVPDFLLASRTSEGYKWAMIELESPRERVLTQAGLPAKKAAEGLKQIRDWRIWLRENIAYARNQLDLKDIDAEIHAYLIIGRRHKHLQKQVKLYRELSDPATTVMSYDRLNDLVGRSLIFSGVDNGQ